MLVLMLALLAVLAAACQPALASNAGYENYTMVLYGQEFMFLTLLVVGILSFVLPRKYYAPGKNVANTTTFRFVFYGLIATGIYVWYYCTAVHWFHAHTDNTLADANDDDDDGVADGNVDSIQDGRLPRLLAPSSVSGHSYAWTWILMIIGVGLFMAETSCLEYINDMSSYMNMKITYWFLFAFAVATHVLVTILLYCQTAYTSAILYSVAAVIYLFGIITYFTKAFESWAYKSSDQMRTEFANRMAASQKLK